MLKRMALKIFLSNFIQRSISACSALNIKTLIFVKLMNSLNHYLNKKGFVAKISVRPHERLQLENRFSQKSIEKDWGIVFHGKITNLETLTFLIGNIKSARNISANISIVVSTYEDEFYSELKDAIYGLDIGLVLCQDIGELDSDYPKSLCQQIETTSTGLNYLLSKNIAKGMKIRVDQKINIESTILLVEKLFLAFPSCNGNTSNRIWTTSYNSYLRRPLGASDMLMVGFTEDLAKYWSRISTADWMEFTRALSQKYPIDVYREFRIPETWLAARYMERMHIDLTSPEQANFVFWRDYMGIINSAHLNHHWLKSHEWLGSNFHTLNWFGKLLNQQLTEITFEDWVSIYAE
jgi:hypothetical protein